MIQSIYLSAWGVLITPRLQINGKYAWVVCGNIDGSDILDEQGNYTNFTLNYEGDTPTDLYESEEELECVD